MIEREKINWWGEVERVNGLLGRGENLGAPIICMMCWGQYGVSSSRGIKRM